MLQNTRNAEFNSMWLILRSKTFSVIIVPFHWSEQKKSYLSNQNLSSRFASTCRIIFHSVEFLASFWDSHFIVFRQFQWFSVVWTKKIDFHQINLSSRFASFLTRWIFFSLWVSKLLPKIVIFSPYAKFFVNWCQNTTKHQQSLI